MPEMLSNGLTIHYDTFGDSRDPAVLLVMGLGTQMIAWRTEFCQQLAARGLYVVRFDNRDIGLSTKIHGAPLPSLPRTLLLRYGVVFRDLPMTSTGKVQKFVLREWAKAV